MLVRVSCPFGLQRLGRECYTVRVPSQATMSSTHDLTRCVLDEVTRALCVKR